MSGGSGVDPYYQKDPPQKQSRKMGPASQASETAQSSPQRKLVNVEEARHLYFDERLNLARVASRLRTSASTIWHAFQERGWVTAKGISLDEDIHRLYFRERLSKSEAARILGVKRGEVEKAFQHNRWRSIPPSTIADPEEAHRLYEQGLTHKDVAKKIGVSPAAVRDYLKRLGANSRAPARRKKYKTEEEWLEGRRESGRRALQKIRELRDLTFGTRCRLCGVSQSKRKLPIHRKDCMKHDYDQLWRPSFLHSVNPEEWARVCTMCHGGVHWANDELGIDWPTLEALSAQKRSEEPETRESTQLNPDSTQPSSRNNFPTPNLNRTVEDMRRELFGDECYFCGPIPEGKRVVIHRKDGAKHANDLLKSEDYLRQLNPEEWVTVCQKHHHYVHWSRNCLGLEWNDIESLLREKK